MNSKKILFICGHYASPRYANSICVKNLAEEFSRMGCEVWVVGMNDTASKKNMDYNGIHTLLLPEPYLSRTKNEKEKWHQLNLWLRGMQRVLHSIYSIFFYPNVDYPKSSKLCKAVSQIIHKEGINIVIATYKPYSAIHSAIKIKELCPRTRVVTYHLDLLLSPHNSSRFIRRYKNFLASRTIDRELKVVDKILLPTSAPLITSDKVSYVDFPLYIPAKDNVLIDAVFTEDTVNIAYVGSLDEFNRNPSFIFKIIKELPIVTGKKVVLHIWGGICDSILKETNTTNVIYHGMANSDDVPRILASADFVLSIGNKITYNMIPSKIFQMFAAKKPVLFVQKHMDDKSVRYYKDYGAAEIIKEYCESVEDGIDILISFIENYYKRHIIVSDQLFEKSTPRYICNEIIG